MKVRLTITVDVDPEAWDLAYATGTDAKSVREDVKTYVLNQVKQSAAEEEGAIIGVTSR